MRNGFTLIELLIVIAIVAILAGAMVPMLNVSRQDARWAKAAAEVDAIKTAAILLHYDTSEWPPAGTAGNDFLADDSGFSGWNGPYLDDWKDDPWGSPYQIYNSGTQRRVRSFGADRQVGGTAGTPDEDIDYILTFSY